MPEFTYNQKRIALEFFIGLRMLEYPSSIVKSTRLYFLLEYIYPLKFYAIGSPLLKMSTTIWLTKPAQTSKYPLNPPSEGFGFGKKLPTS
jgi:hypothetical protein